jgi:hypothetical protein
VLWQVGADLQQVLLLQLGSLQQRLGLWRANNAVERTQRRSKELTATL